MVEEPAIHNNSAVAVSVPYLLYIKKAMLELAVVADTRRAEASIGPLPPLRACEHYNLSRSPETRKQTLILLFRVLGNGRSCDKAAVSLEVCLGDDQLALVLSA